MVEFLSRPWQTKLADLLASSDQSLLIATPYIKRDAAQWLLDTLTSRRQAQPIRTTVITDISPQSALNASLDLDALLLLATSLRRIAIFDVHRLHAKVYLADEKQAIITSANFTSSAFTANYEYGILVTDPEMVKKVSSDMRSYAGAGRQVTRAELARLDETTGDFRREYERATERAAEGARRELTREWDRIASTFGAPPGLHEIGSARFKGPIMKMLASQGPLTTKQLCEAIQAFWPYLCDDTLMRVAKDGTRKRQWRHDIHTAQETLQRAGMLRRDAKGLWHIEGGGQ